MHDEVTPDWQREERIGLPEAVFCSGKSTDQIAHILEVAHAGGRPLLLTRLAPDREAALPAALRDALDYDPRSATAILGAVPAPQPSPVGIVTAGTSDVPAALEAQRTLAFCGHAASMIADVGVAGLWRLLDRLPELRALDIVIACAGMEGALFSVLGGQVPGLVIAVPTSVGYGVAAGGDLALRAALASCAPGVAVVNIDNGHGAACIALRALRATSGASRKAAQI